LAPKLAAPFLVAEGLEGPVVDVLLVELEPFDEELLDDVAEVVLAVLVLSADDAEETTEERAETMEEATEAWEDSTEAAEVEAAEAEPPEMENIGE
jgi:hypothetical protein